MEIEYSTRGKALLMKLDLEELPLEQRLEIATDIIETFATESEAETRPEENRELQKRLKQLLELLEQA